MTDVQKCDGCGAIAHNHGTTFDLATRVWDPDVTPNAVDIVRNGHLCNECAREVAHLINSLGGDE